MIVATNLKKGVEEETERDTQYFPSSATPVLETTQISIASHVEHIEGKVDDFIRNGSGWVVEGVKEITIAISPYQPLYNSGGSFISLPAGLKRKKSLINIQNQDEM